MLNKRIVKFNNNSLMKNFLVSLLLLSCTYSLYAQEDRFSAVSQTKGKNIYLTDNSALNVAYTIVDGKVKSIKKIKNFPASISGKVYAVENDIYNYKKTTYIVLKGTGETILLKEEDAPLYLSSFISKTYWQEKYDSYKNDYLYFNFKKYIQVHSANANYLKEKKEEGREQADAKRVPRHPRNPPYGRLSGGSGYFTAILMLESPKRAMTTSPAFTAIEAVPLMAFTRPTILPSPV